MHARAVYRSVGDDKGKRVEGRGKRMSEVSEEKSKVPKRKGVSAKIRLSCLFDGKLFRFEIYVRATSLTFRLDLLQVVQWPLRRICTVSDRNDYKRPCLCYHPTATQ